MANIQIPWEGLTGKEKYRSVRNYMENLGLPVLGETKNCVDEKYVKLTDGTSVNVKDHFFHVFCGETAASAISMAIGMKPELDDKPGKQDFGVRPLAFRRINDDQLILALNSLHYDGSNVSPRRAVRTGPEYSKVSKDEIAHCDAEDVTGVDGKEKERIITARVNQSVIRNNAIRKYGCRCVLCGLRTKELLVASHIKAWAESNSEEKGDPDNVLLLCPDHDAVFDRHLITFDDDGNIMISDQLDAHERAMLNLRPDMKIQMNDAMRRYMQYHREKSPTC